jgi:hypothetical protein
MTKIFLSIIIVMAILSCAGSTSVNSQKFDLTTNCDTISYKQFEEKVSIGIDEMNTGDSLKIEDMIDLARIFTTLQFAEYDSMGAKRNYFYSLFDAKCRSKIIESFECITSSGVLYSKKYKLYIGPSRYMTCSNYYTVQFPKSSKYVPKFEYKSKQ